MLWIYLSGVYTYFHPLVIVAWLVQYIGWDFNSIHFFGDFDILYASLYKVMESCQVFVFGDLTIPFEEDLRQLLHTKGHGSLSSFFDRVGFALREEITKLPSRQQHLLPRFTTLVDLLFRVKESEGAPALKFALLCLYQIGQFIRYEPRNCFQQSSLWLTDHSRYYGEGSRPFPSADNSYLVGTCTGSFAAAAISTSQTLSELVAAGVEAVLVAFRTGLCSLELRNDIERPIPEASRSWSAVVGAQEPQVTEFIETISSAKVSPQMYW